MYTWKQLTPELVTKLFLYNQEELPDDLTDEKWIRDKGVKPKFFIDAVSYMLDGPGRFARASQVPIIEKFFSGELFQKTGKNEEFTVEMMMAEYMKLFPEKDQNLIERHAPQQIYFRDEQGSQVR